MPDQPEVFLERMTWPEIEAAVAAGQTRAVVCLAATEQHGPHLPEGTDAWLGEELAGRVARALGDALVAPVIRPGCSEHHMGFAGTITVPVEALLMLLDAYVDSLLRHGFDRFLVFTSHGGNLPALTSWPGRSRPAVTVLDDLTAVTEAIQQAVSRFGVLTAAGRHADLGETAAMLAVQPELVRLELAERGFEGEIGLGELLTTGMRALSPSGTFGDPTGATAEMGAAVLAAWTECLLDDLHRQPGGTSVHARTPNGVHGNEGAAGTVGTVLDLGA
jgi:creatinine amidohydrolase